MNGVKVGDVVWGLSFEDEHSDDLFELNNGRGYVGANDATECQFAGLWIVRNPDVPLGVVRAVDDYGPGDDMTRNLGTLGEYDA